MRKREADVCSLTHLRHDTERKKRVLHSLRHMHDSASHAGWHVTDCQQSKHVNLAT